MNTSFPFLAISKKYNIEYGLILLAAELSRYAYNNDGLKNRIVLSQKREIHNLPDEVRSAVVRLVYELNLSKDGL